MAIQKVWTEKFAEMSHGKTRYWEAGSSAGYPTILIHGAGWNSGPEGWVLNIGPLAEKLHVAEAQKTEVRKGARWIWLTAGAILGAAMLAEACRGKKTSMKAALLDQTIVAGLGNIYVCEALFRAGINPKTAAQRIGVTRYRLLAGNIRETLGAAIRAGGSSLRDFRDAYGSEGHFQLATQVYGREGEPCRACGTTIKRIVQGQRSTFFCPVCQKR